MKKMMLILAVALCSVAYAKEVSIQEARSQIGAAIGDSAKMTEIIKGLSNADQVQFLADVNAAIEKMPGSVEAKTAKYLNANRAALKGANKGNHSALIAETFATVPLEALTVINERFAADLFNRAANPGSYTDEQFAKIATDLQTKVNERVSGVENAAQRETFAALMMIRASNGTPADLTAKLVEMLPESSREPASKEWIPAAMGSDKQEKSYEPILASGGAARPPIYRETLIFAGPQLPETMLGYLVEQSPFFSTSTEEIGFGFTAYQMLDEDLKGEPVFKPEVEEPRPYNGQFDRRFF